MKHSVEVAERNSMKHLVEKGLEREMEDGSLVAIP